MEKKLINELKSKIDIGDAINRYILIYGKLDEDLDLEGNEIYEHYYNTMSEFEKENLKIMKETKLSNLNGKELHENEIITNVESENISQHGIDLNVVKIEKIVGNGFIPAKGKTQLPQYEEVKPHNNVWELQPGLYNITFKQGCNIPNGQMLLIRQRSSLMRCGGSIHSSVFDAGFKTSNIGTFMQVIYPLKIEVGARVAQIYNHKTDLINNLYEGQFQNDQQRKK